MDTRRRAATDGRRSLPRSSRSTKMRESRPPAASRRTPTRSRRSMFTTRFEAWVRRQAEALMSAVGRLPLTPNQVTVVGFVLTIIAATLAAFGHLLLAGGVLIFAGPL